MNGGCDIALPESVPGGIDEELIINQPSDSIELETKHFCGLL
jgi:hypothetical protein